MPTVSFNRTVVSNKQLRVAFSSASFGPSVFKQLCFAETSYPQYLPPAILRMVNLGKMQSLTIQQTLCQILKPFQCLLPVNFKEK